MCTHNLCFEQKLEKCHFFSGEIFNFNAKKISVNGIFVMIRGNLSKVDLKCTQNQSFE